MSMAIMTALPCPMWGFIAHTSCLQRLALCRNLCSLFEVYSCAKYMPFLIYDH